MRISDWSSDVCSSDLWSVAWPRLFLQAPRRGRARDGWPVCLARHPQNNRTANLAHWTPGRRPVRRSEEHTSELQSLMRISYAVFCLKKKNKNTKTRQIQIHNINTK